MDKLRQFHSSLLRGDDLRIVPESTLTLWARDAYRGEVVKRSLTSVENAMVLEERHEVQLEHVFTGQKIDEWVPVEQVVSSIPFERGDRVIYKNWLGTVEAVLDMGAAVVPSGETNYILDPFGVGCIGRQMKVSASGVPPRSEKLVP